MNAFFSIPNATERAFQARDTSIPALTIEGRVLQRNDRPFPIGNRIAAVAFGPDGSHAAYAACDLDGRFVLELAKRGKYRLGVDRTRHLIFEELHNVEVGTKGHIIYRAETGTITGSVVSPTGQPIGGVTVTAVPTKALDKAGMPISSRNRPAWYGMQGRSDESGKFTIAENLLAKYVLVAYHPDYAPTLMRNVGWKEQVVQIVLRPGHSLSGAVTPACAARVQVLDRWGFARTNQTQDDGLFTVHGLDAGDCEVTATAQNQKSAEPVHASAGATGVVVPLVSTPAR